MATSTMWKTPKTTPHLSCTGHLAKLPLELQQMILPHVKPSAVYALRQTCRFFYHSFAMKDLPLKTVLRWLKILEMEPINDGSFACFACFQLKPANGFMSNHIHLPTLKKGSPRAHLRQCIDCCIEQKIIQPGDLIHEAEYPTSGSALLALCYGCNRFKRDFCWNCRLCRSCVRVEKCRKKEWGIQHGRIMRVPHDFNCPERETAAFARKLDSMEIVPRLMFLYR